MPLVPAGGHSGSPKTTAASASKPQEISKQTPSKDGRGRQCSSFSNNLSPGESTMLVSAVTKEDLCLFAHDLGTHRHTLLQCRPLSESNAGFPNSIERRHFERSLNKSPTEHQNQTVTHPPSKFS